MENIVLFIASATGRLRRVTRSYRYKQRGEIKYPSYFTKDYEYHKSAFLEAFC